MASPNQKFKNEQKSKSQGSPTQRNKPDPKPVKKDPPKSTPVKKDSSKQAPDRETILTELDTLMNESGKDKKEMSVAEAMKKAIQQKGRTEDLFGNELDYVNVLNKAGIGYDDIKEIRKAGNNTQLAAKNFFEDILEKQIAANPINSDLLQKMTDYEVPLDEQGNPMFDSYKRIGIGDEELYGNPLANVPFLSGLGSIIPNTRNDFASLAADSIVGFPGVTSMARGLMDKIAGGSGDYTAAQRYFKNYFPDDQAKVNQLALASLDPKFQQDIFENPVFEASQNYDKARNTLPEKEQAAPLGLAALAPTPTVTTGPTPYNATIYSNNTTGNTTNNATGNTTNNATAFSPYASTANYKSLGIPQVAPNAPGGFSGAFPGYYDYLTKYFGR
jgi:hypothetical protein